MHEVCFKIGGNRHTAILAKKVLWGSRFQFPWPRHRWRTPIPEPPGASRASCRFQGLQGFRLGYSSAFFWASSRFCLRFQGQTGLQVVQGLQRFLLGPRQKLTLGLLRRGLDRPSCRRQGLQASRPSSAFRPSRASLGSLQRFHGPPGSSWAFSGLQQPSVASRLSWISRASWAPKVARAFRRTPPHTFARRHVFASFELQDASIHARFEEETCHVLHCEGVPQAEASPAKRFFGEKILFQLSLGVPLACSLIQQAASGQRPPPTEDL